MVRIIRRVLCVILSIFFFFTYCIHYVSAGECEYGTVYGSFSIDGVRWENATVPSVVLQRGQSFYIRVNTRTKLDMMAVSYELWETGEINAHSSSFEILEGLDCFFHFCPIYQVTKDTTTTYQWKCRVRPNTSWTGNAPLNIQVSFNRDDTDACHIYFTVVNIQISNEQWNENVSKQSVDLEKSNESHRIMRGVPGFDLVLIVIGMFILLFFKGAVRKYLVHSRRY